MKKKIVALLCAIGVISSSANAFAMGISTHIGDYNCQDTIDAITSVSGNYVRDEVNWNLVETTKGGEKIIPEKHLEYIKGVDDAGVNMLLILSYGNANYGWTKKDGTPDNFVMPTKDNPEYYQAFLDYVRFMVTEVGEYVDAWEIWNEPDLTASFNTQNASIEQYAELCIDTSAIIRELDPTAKVLVGSFAGNCVDWVEKIFKAAAATEAGVNGVIDAVSVHSYTTDPEGTYRIALGLSKGETYDGEYYAGYETPFETYSFDGEVWITESGQQNHDKVLSDDEQGQLIIKNAIAFAEYLRKYNREGEQFWYTLVDAYNHEFGLFESGYSDKPASNSMRAFNKAIRGKTLSSHDEPQTASESGLFGNSTKYYGQRATYTGETGTTYVAYDKNGRDDTKMTFDLSGNVAYVYDYQGNVTQKIENPSGTVEVAVSAAPIIVECVTNGGGVTSAKYDDETNTVRVVGYYNAGDTVTIELVKDGAVAQTETAKVTDGVFDKWFSVDATGTYTVRLNDYQTKTAEFTKAAVTAPAFAAGTSAVYNSENKTVTVSGEIENYTDDQYVTIMAVPETADLANVNADSIGYIKQIEVTDGAFNVSFTLPEYHQTKTAVYVGATGVDASVDAGTADIAENKYLYVASFDATKGDTFVATAIVRNFAETARGASIIVAEYNEGKLVKVTSKPMTVNAKTYAETAISSDAITLDSTTTAVNAYIWDSLTGIKPLADDVTK